MNKRIVSFFFLLLFTGSIYAAIDITDLRTELHLVELLLSPEGSTGRQAESTAISLIQIQATME